MIATVINAAALQRCSGEDRCGYPRSRAAIEMREVAEPYMRRRAIRHPQRSVEVS